MKPQLKIWTKRFITLTILTTTLLLVIILHPVLTYAKKTKHHNLTIYHTKTLQPSLALRIDQAMALVRQSEFYNKELQLELCLNDGAVYPQIMRGLRGQAFAWGFYDKVVLQGTADSEQNIVSLNGYKWNLSQLLAHEIVHCLQFDQLGLFNSKPIKNIPNWKWEGYPEYIARQNPDQKDLAKNLDRLASTDPAQWEMRFSDQTIVSRTYFEYWTLVSYCLDIKKMSYLQLLNDNTAENLLRQEMINWHHDHKSSQKQR